MQTIHSYNPNFLFRLKILFSLMNATRLTSLASRAVIAVPNFRGADTASLPILESVPEV